MKKTLKYIIYLFSVAVLLGGCDEVENYIDAYNPDDVQVQQEEINDVVDIQNNAGEIINNLFTSGADTLSVKDSIASFFIQNNSVYWSFHILYWDMV